MTNKFWVGGSGNITDTNHWSDSSGGAGGATLPGSGDNVAFDSESNHSGSDAAYTVTVNSSFSCADMSFTRSGDPSTGGLPTLAISGSSYLYIYGSLTLCASMGWTYSYTIVFKSTGLALITTSGVKLVCSITFDGVGGTFRLVDDLALDKSGGCVLTLTNGTFDATTNSRSVTFGTTYSSSIIGAFTFYNLYHNISGKTYYMSLSNDITVQNIFGPIGDKTNRLLVKSSVPGTARTITCNGTVSANGCDFQDIIGAGSASWDLSAASNYVGMCPSANSGITGTTAADQTFTASANANWSTAARWTSRVPLPQDDVIGFNISGSGITITSDMPRMGKNVNFNFTGTYNNPVLSQSVDNVVFGSLTLASTMSRTGNYHTDFQGTGDAILTSAGVSLHHILLNKPGYTLSLADDLVCTDVGIGTNIVNYGTFDASDHNVTMAGFSFNSSSITYMGSGIWTITGTTGYAWGNSYSGTLYCETSTIRFTNVAASCNFSGGSKTYYNLEFAGSANYTAQISGANTFNRIHIDASQAPKQINFTISTTQIISSLTRDKNPGTKKITLRNSSSTTRATLQNASGGCIILPDYMDVDYLNFTSTNALAAKWAYSGEHNVKGRNCSGITDYAGWVETNEYPTLAYVGTVIYTLDAASGTFVLTGTNASLLKSSLLAANAGSYTVTGTNANLLKSCVLVAGNGAYTLEGQPINLLKSYVVTAEAGSYAISGQAANLLKSWKITVEPGSFVLTGQDADLIYTQTGRYTLIAASGSFTLTGQNATLLHDKILSASAGSYNIAGQDAGLLLSRRLAAEIGSFEIQGRDVSLLIGRVIQAGSGSYVITGASATLTYSGLRYYIEVVELDSAITKLVELDSGIGMLSDNDSGL